MTTEALLHKACNGGLRKEKTPTENSRGLCTGGAGGSRTRVRKHSMVSSTYLVMSFGFNSRPRRQTGLERTSYLRFSLCPSNPSKSDPILMTLRIVFRRPTRWAL